MKEEWCFVQREFRSERSNPAQTADRQGTSDYATRGNRFAIACGEREYACLYLGVFRSAVTVATVAKTVIMLAQQQPNIMKFAFTFILCTSTIYAATTAPPAAAKPGLHVTMTEAGVAQVSLATLCDRG